MKCAACGAENSDVAEVCAGCAAPLSLDCPSCGSENSPRNRYCGQCGAPLSVEASGRSTGPAAAALPAAATAGTERRQLTIMFCDLVGSTALSERLELEEYDEVLLGYRRTCKAVAERFDGFLARFTGDGILFYFGYPNAHEDDAERAVRAALGIVEALSEAVPRLGHALQVRIGIATGVVMAGDIASDGILEAGAVRGETPNLAARIQAVAEPNAVAISSDTHKLIGEAFDCTDLGMRDFKGFSKPVRVWQVTGAREFESRFEAAQALRPSALIGRDQEFELLIERWKLAKQGRGQAVLLAGEPGIGKSRVVVAVRDKIRDEPHVRVFYQCSPYFRQTAHYPIVKQLERAAEFRRDDTADQRLQKLEFLLKQSTDDLTESVPLVAAMMSIPTGDRYPPLNLTPQQQKARIGAALVDAILGLARAQPVLVVLEDAHWIDPTTMETLELLIGRMREARVLLLITFRPEFDAPWESHPHLSRITLNQLSHRQAMSLVARTAGGRALPDRMVLEIVARADGVPLFIEELTKAVLESGFLGGGEPAGVPEAPTPQGIPATLRDSLMARLDRLGPIKEVVQIGAAIGRVFSHELLAKVSALPDERLRDALAKLANAELVFPRGRPPEATYAFKHTLLQDAAYESLLKTQRQKVHARIGEALETQAAAGFAQEPELIAHHFTAAGLHDQAVPYWLEAGRSAARQSANIEATAHFNKGLELLATLPEGHQRDELDLALQLYLGRVMYASRGYGALGTREPFYRARDLCLKLGDKHQLFPALSGIFGFHFGQGDMDDTLRSAKELAQLAEETGNPTHAMWAHICLGAASSIRGEFTAAMSQINQGLALYDPERHAWEVFTANHDAKGIGLQYAGYTLWALGYPDQALRAHQEYERHNRELRHPYALGHVLIWGTTVYYFRREPHVLRQKVTEGIAIAVEQDFPYLIGAGKCALGWAVAMEGDAGEGIELIREGLGLLEHSESKLGTPYLQGLLVEALEKAGRVEEGLRLVGEAIDLIERSGQRLNEAEIYRMKGRLLLARETPDADGAEAEFRKAIAVADGQQAKGWKIRAATSLARLCHDQGRTDEARRHLMPVYGWFKEGLDTADLRDARALLDRLG